MKLFFISLSLASIAYAQNLQKDTVYHIRFISSEDLSPLTFAPVKAHRNGIIIASWQADMSGCITVRKKEIDPCSGITIALNYLGFEKVSFSAGKLFPNDTTLIPAKPKSEMFDEITIISYKVPMIEKETKSRRRHKKQEKKEPEKFPVHSPQQCIAYEALQKGVWLRTDTAMRNHILAYDSLKHYKPKNGYGPARLFQQYFINNIRYPEQAIDFLIEEKIYLSFELNDKGEINYIKVLRGTSVDLVLEAANALARLPRLNLRDEFSEYDESYPRKHLKPIRYVLPVVFTLK